MPACDPRALATRIRAHALRMVHRARASHVGGCLSAADVLAQLYGQWLRVDPQRPNRPERDRVIVSKGHAAAAVYAALAEAGFFPTCELERFCADGSPLAGHVSKAGVPGVEVSTGALGHGLALGVGMALGVRHDGLPSRVVVLMSDGECDEGSTWEAALLAAGQRLSNLLAIVDYNRMQALGPVEDVLPLEPFTAKWEAFGWCAREVDGHDHAELAAALADVPFSGDRPSVIIARTVKGKGVPFMEGALAWHYRSPNDEELAAALQALETPPAVEASV